MFLVGFGLKVQPYYFEAVCLQIKAVENLMPNTLVILVDFQNKKNALA
jgi:hypothetical protein